MSDSTNNHDDPRAKWREIMQRINKLLARGDEHFKDETGGDLIVQREIIVSLREECLELQSQVAACIHKKKALFEQLVAIRGECVEAQAEILNAFCQFNPVWSQDDDPVDTGESTGRLSTALGQTEGLVEKTLDLVKEFNATPPIMLMLAIQVQLAAVLFGLTRVKSAIDISQMFSSLASSIKH